MAIRRACVLGRWWSGLVPKPISTAAPVARRRARGLDPRRGALLGASSRYMVKDLIEGEGATTPILGAWQLFNHRAAGDPEFAAALASAYNDYQGGEWLGARVRGRSVAGAGRAGDRDAARRLGGGAGYSCRSSPTSKWGGHLYRPIWRLLYGTGGVCHVHQHTATETLPRAASPPHRSGTRRRHRRRREPGHEPDRSRSPPPLSGAEVDDVPAVPT